MIVSTQDQMYRLRSAFKRAMQLDFQGLAQLGRNVKMFVVFIKPDITACPVLPELDRVPLIALLKTRKTTLASKFFPGKKPLEGFTESISECLYRGGGYMFTATSFETGGKIILPRKRLLVLILLFDRLKHLIVQEARPDQALHEQVGLFRIWVQAVLECSHILMVAH